MVLGSGRLEGAKGGRREVVTYLKSSQFKKTLKRK
jgi:hypothetical protein